jgi:uncharacterized protein (TIGR02300 family)
MTKPELGAKRLCAYCGTKFYDLHRSPITCPKCGRAFEPVEVSSRFRPAPEPVREVEPVMAEVSGGQLVSSEDADEAEREDRPGLGPEAEDEVEPDDNSLDDAPLIEESEEEDTDVTEIIGDDIDTEEGD